MRGGEGKRERQKQGGKERPRDRKTDEGSKRRRYEVKEERRKEGENRGKENIHEGSMYSMFASWFSRWTIREEDIHTHTHT